MVTTEICLITSKIKRITGDKRWYVIKVILPSGSNRKLFCFNGGESLITEQTYELSFEKQKYESEVVTSFKIVEDKDGMTDKFCVPWDTESFCEYISQKIMGEGKAKEFYEALKTLLGDEADNFFQCPASQERHNARARGLIHHIVKVFRNGLAACKQYELSTVKYALYCLMHDIGKAYVYGIDEGEISADRKTEAKFGGHIGIGMKIWSAKGVSFLEEIGAPEGWFDDIYSAIVSHHRRLESGSMAEPSDNLSWVLHFSDNMDAKVQ